jgi:hypothetical protein
MTDTMKTIRIVDSPSQPGMEVAFGIAFQVRSPRSDHSITVMINPAVDDYQEQQEPTPGIEVRQVSLMHTTSETQTFLFDLDGSPAHTTYISGQRYDIRLLKVGKVNEDGKDWPTYEFTVTQR